MDDITIYQEEIIEALNKIMATLEKKPGQFEERSKEINEVAAALSKAQAEFLVAHMKGINAFHKSPYEDLSELIRVTRPALTKYGLSVTFSVCSYPDTSDILHTYLYHASGQFLASHIKLTPPRNNLEAIKSYTDAIMRMMYKSLLGISATNDDDDGEGAMWEDREVVAKGTALNRNMNTKDESPETISTNEIRELEKALDGDQELAERLLDSYKIRSIADIPKSMFFEILTKTRQIKERQKRAQ